MSDIIPPDPIRSKKYGIATIANDRVIDWLLPLLESYKMTSASIPLYIIPYDDNLDRTRRAADLYGAEVVSLDNSELDALARKLYPLNPGHRRRLRKLLSLALPLDEVVYIDADIVLLDDVSKVLGHLDAGKTDFIVAAQSFDYIYNSHFKSYDFLRDALLFNDGFFVASRHVLSLQDFYDVIAADERTFHKVRQRGGLFAQPLTNFVVHRRNLKIATLSQMAVSLSGESYYKSEGILVTEQGAVDRQGEKLLFCHWPGIIGMPRRRRPIDILWHEIADKAAARMATRA